MAILTINGAVSTVSGAYSNFKREFCQFEQPTARLSRNGDRPIQYTSLGIELWRTADLADIRLFLAFGSSVVATTGLFQPPLSTGAGDFGDRHAFEAVYRRQNAYGSTCRFGWWQSSIPGGTASSVGVKFNRDATSQSGKDIQYQNGGTINPTTALSVTGTTYSDASLVGTINWGQVPSAPQTPAGSVDGSSVTATWTAPSDSGDVTGTGYDVELHYGTAFGSLYATKHVAAGVLTATFDDVPAGDYRARISATNQLSDAYDDGSPWADVAATLTVTVGAGGLKVYDGAGPRPMEMFVFDGTESLPLEPFVYDGAESLPLS